MPKLCIHILATVLAFTVAASPVLGQEAGGADAAPASADAGAPTAEPNVDVVSSDPGAPAADVDQPTAETAPAVSVSDAEPVAPAPPSTCGATPNPWGFTYCAGGAIQTAPEGLCSVFACIPTFWRQVNGYVVQCRDMLLNHSGGVRGACSSHGGELRPLYAS